MSETLQSDLSQKALSAVKYTVIYRTISQLVGIVTLIVLVRLLSKHDYGVYHLLYSVIALIGMVASLGIANTLQRFMPEYYSRGEFVLANKLYRTFSLLRLLSNVLILGVLILFWDFFGTLLKISEYKNYFLLFSLVILLHMQRGLLETCLASYFLQKYSQKLSAIFALIKGIGYTLAFIMRWNLWLIIIIDLLAYIIIFILLQMIYSKKIPKQGGVFSRFPEEEKKRVRRYAFFYNFNDAGVGMLNVNFDNFIIVMFLDPVAVGGYAFCNRVTKMAQRVMPTNYLSDVIRPLFFVGNKEKNLGEIQRNFQLLFKTVFLFACPLFVAFLLLSREVIVVIFNGEFIDYYLILIAVACSNFLNTFSVPVGLVAQLKEKADIIFYSKIFAVYNLLADIALIPFLGIWGAVLATGTALLGKNLYIWFHVRDAAPFSGMSEFFIKMFVYWSFVAYLWLFARQFIGGDTLRLGFGIIYIAMGCYFQLRTISFSQWEWDLLHSLSAGNKKVGILLKWSGLLHNNNRK